MRRRQHRFLRQENLRCFCSWFEQYFSVAAKKQAKKQDRKNREKTGARQRQNQRSLRASCKMTVRTPIANGEWENAFEWPHSEPILTILTILISLCVAPFCFLLCVAPFCFLVGLTAFMWPQFVPVLPTPLLDQPKASSTSPLLGT